MLPLAGNARKSRMLRILSVLTVQIPPEGSVGLGTRSGGGSFARGLSSLRRMARRIRKSAGKTSTAAMGIRLTLSQQGPTGMFLAIRCYRAANDLGIYGTNLSARPRCPFCMALPNPHDDVAADSDFRPCAAVFCTNRFHRCGVFSPLYRESYSQWSLCVPPEISRQLRKT
jgi:hypothetical protein